MQLLIQTGAGVLLGMAGVVLLWQSGRGNQDMDNMKDYLFVTIKELVIGKLMGLFVVSESKKKKKEVILQLRSVV